MRKLVGITALFAGLALLFSAGAMPAYADPGNGNGSANAHGANPNANANASAGHSNSGGNANATGGSNGGSANGGTSQAGDPNGANGTVKIHDWPEHKNGSDMANDPKVCQFEIHGFKFDRGQTGRWWIQDHKWGNGDPSQSVLAGTYGPADANGDWTSGPYKLADGHYKLFVEMTHSAGNSGKTVTTYKHKVFKVECPTSSAPTGSGSSTNSSTNTNSNSSSSNTNSSNTNSTTTTDVETSTTVRNIETGNVVIRVETTTFTEAGETVRIVRIFNNDVLVLTFDSRTAGSVVAGFESAPTGAAIFGTGPEIPAGMGLDDSQGLTGVNGAQSAPMGAAGSESTPEAALAGIASLPATSTGAPALGLAGLAITGLGLALLRRQPK